MSDEPFDPGEAEVAALVEAALGQAQRESARDKVIEAALDAGIRLWRDELGEAFASLPRPEGGIERSGYGPARSASACVSCTAVRTPSRAVVDGAGRGAS